MTRSSSHDAAPKLSPDVIAKRLDRDSVLIHLPTNKIFELNETGTRIWELLGQGLDVETIARRLADEFEVGQDRAVKEVTDLIHQLQTAGLLTP